jgi:sugar-phosphatase
MSFRAFLFDLDGTLIDSETIWVKAVGRALRDSEHEWSAADLSVLVYGRSWLDIFAEVRRRHPGTYPDVDAMVNAIRRHYADLRRSRDIRIPGSVEALKQLAAASPVAIVSGSTRQDVAAAIAELGIGQHVSLALGCEDYSPGKPHPACFRLAAERLAVPPGACLVFEDSTPGVHAAKGAGMTCMALHRPGRPPQDLSAADLVVDDLGECVRDGRAVLTVDRGQGDANQD